MREGSGEDGSMKRCSSTTRTGSPGLGDRAHVNSAAVQSKSEKLVITLLASREIFTRIPC